jgi:hypothetical protein
MKKALLTTAIATLFLASLGTAEARHLRTPASFRLTTPYGSTNINGPAVEGQEVPANADLGTPLHFEDPRIDSPKGWNLSIEIRDQTGGSVFSIADIGPKTEVPFCTSTSEPIVVPPHTKEVEVGLYDGSCEGAQPSVVTDGSLTLTFHTP